MAIRTYTVAAFVTALACAACDDGASDHLARVEASERLPGGATTNTLLLGQNAFSRHASNITPDHERMFFTGNSLFNAPWVQAPSSTTARDGLGPLFNARACSACHFRDGRGAPPTEEGGDFVSMLVRVSVEGENDVGGPAPHPLYGGQLQPLALPDVPAEVSPRVTYSEVAGTYADGTPYTLLRPNYAFEDFRYGDPGAELLFSPRVAPQMIGLGLLEAIPEDRLNALADPDDTDGDGISGRTNRVWDVLAQEHRVGRFGWKAEEPTVRQQSAGAFLGDMGITSPLFPEQQCSPNQAECLAAVGGGVPEIDAEMFDRVVVYSSLLAPAARRGADDVEVRRGKRVFNDVGCASCHTPSHETGPHAEFPEVEYQTIWPYTDLLLHDMGPDLADGRPVFEADGREWRTPPLWGIGLIPDVNGHDRLLHDGRARGVAEAVLWHGGEGQAARDAFAALPSDERAALVTFVESL